MVGRDGVQHLGEGDAALHVADLAVELEAVAPEVAGQAQHRGGVGSEVSLIGQVVDGEDARRSMERRIVPVEGLQVDGHEARLPVVGVEDVRALAPAAEVFQAGAGEEGEAEPVVVVVVIAGAVEVGPVKERRVLDEDDRDPVLQRPAVEARAARQRVHRDVHRAQELSGRERDGSVAGEEDGDAVTEAHERLRKRGGDVGKAARLGEGSHLGGRIRDVQRLGHGGRGRQASTAEAAGALALSAPSSWSGLRKHGLARACGEPYFFKLLNRKEFSGCAVGTGPVQSLLIRPPRACASILMCSNEARGAGRLPRAAPTERSVV